MTGRRRWSPAIPAVVVSAALSLAACGSGDSESQEGAHQDDPDATLLVWTDATRQPGFEMYQKSHPDVKMKIETFDEASLLTKIQLSNRSGKGWPDVVFDGSPNDVAALSNSVFRFTQPLDELVPEDVQKDFGTSNSGCTIDGKLYCLKNDLAQSVLWYDKTLMHKFGYPVPTTWEEYAALGEKVAKEHPGFIIGTAGSGFGYYDYFWSSGCPLQAVTAPMTVHIDVEDPACTRVTDLLDPLIGLGVVSRQGPFDADVVELGQQEKILMMPGASWYGDFVFKPEGSYDLPDGHLAAAPYLTWPGETTAWSGATGGGIYMVSRHSANLAGATAIAQWMATSSDYQLEAPTYPAYGPAAEEWGAQHGKDEFYAEDPFPVLQAQAALINPAESNTVYSIADAYNSTVANSVKNGGTMADGLPGLQSQLSSLAQSVGYAVE